jgi:hypothetical protein
MLTRQDSGGPFSCWSCRTSFTENNTPLESAFVNFFLTVGKIVNGEKNAHAELRLEILFDEREDEEKRSSATVPEPRQSN